jgi:hypothetical protein
MPSRAVLERVRDDLFETYVVDGEQKGALIASRFRYTAECYSNLTDGAEANLKTNSDFSFNSLLTAIGAMIVLECVDSCSVRLS